MIVQTQCVAKPSINEEFISNITAV